MGRYDGVLICSDIDGTLTYPYTGKDDNLNVIGPTRETCEQIRRFQQEGGYFTVCTGRRPSHLENFTDKFVVNAPVISCGGAMVYDLENQKALRFKTMQFDLPAVMRALQKDFAPYLDRIHLHTLEDTIAVTCEQLADPQSGVWKTDTYLKVVLVFDTAEHAIAARKLVLAHPLAGELDVCRSWPEGLEMMDKEATKGASALFLKDYLGARELICVGDFENDLSMFRVADRAVAVENALPEVKAAASEITVSVYDGAVARVIESIE